MNAGLIGTDIYALNTSAVNLNGGTVTEAVFAQGTSSLVMSGGTVGTGSPSSQVIGSGSAKVTVSGGAINGNLAAIGSSSLYYKGGSVSGQLIANSSSFVTYGGGSVGSYISGGGIYLNDNATMNILGTNLSVTPASFDAGPYAAYNLSGLLADNTTSLQGQVVFILKGTNDTLQFNSVPVTFSAAAPTPNSLLVLLAGFAGIGRRLGHRRKK